VPRAKSRQLPRPKVYTAGNWQGMDDTPDPVAAKPTFVALARNCYIPPRSFGASYLGRPGTTKAGSQLGSSTNRHAQYIGQFTKQDGTEYTVLVFEGEIYTYSWGGDAWTKQVTTANLTTATITLSATARVHGVVFQNTLVLSDGVNTPFTWDGSNGAGGLTKLTNCPVLYGQPVVYYVKLFGIKASERDTMVWSEEAAANTGYEAGGYTNAWTVPNPTNDRMVGLAASNDALTVLWTRSATRVTGAVSTDFQTSSTRAAVSSTIGTGSPSAVAALDEGVVFVDQDGRPHVIPAGATQPEPLYEPCRTFLSTINRSALSTVLLVEDRATETVKIGYADAAESYPSKWLVYTRDGGTLRLTGVESGYTAAVAGAVKNSTGRWVWMHAGDNDGYVYHHGTPEAGPWSDASGASTVPIQRELVTMAFGSDPDIEKVFDQISVQGFAPSNQTLQVYYATPSGMATSQLVTLAGSGDAFDVSLWDTATFSEGSNDLRGRVGILGRGRWLMVWLAQSTTSEQFGIELVRVSAFEEAAEPAIR